MNKVDRERVLTMKKVDKTSPIPLYYQLKTLISELIENEVYKPGDALPPEREFCEIHGISRMTVSKTINSLINEGLLYRQRGKGTYVAHSKENCRLSALHSFTEDMHEKGKHAETKILGFKRGAATRKLAKDLKLSDENKDVYKITRLRYCDAEPYALETVYIAAYLCDSLTEQMLDRRSLYDVLENEFHCKIDYAYQTIEPIIVSGYESEVLSVDFNSPALLLERKTFLKNDVPIEVTKAIYRNDRYKFEVKLYR